MSGLVHRLVTGVVVAFGLTVAVDAAAQGGFALEGFNPSERGSDWFAEDSLDLRGNLRFAAGIVGDYADKPLIIVNANGSTNSVPVENELILHPGATFVVKDRFRFGLDVPVAVYESGTSGVVRTVTYPATTGGGIGDVRISADARLFGRYTEAFTLAAGVSLFLPSGSQTAYMSDGDLRAMPRVLVAGDLGPVAYAAHVGFEIRPSTNAFPGYPTGSELDVGASVGIRAADRRLVLGPEVHAATVLTSASAVFSTRQTPVEGLLGLHYAVSDEWRIGGGAAMGLTKAFGEPLVRGVVALEWVMGTVVKVKDRDHDGIVDDVDACPDLAGIRTEDPKTNGCPVPDRDKDGVADAEDACPDVPGVRTDDPRTNGCPPDRDKDGIPDKEDACPDVPGVRMDDPKTNGCPPDSDKDGVPDSEDACPDVPGVRTSDPKTNGCPEDTDRDKDGIPNAEDACPDVAGPASPDPKRNGCPAAYVQEDLIKTLDALKFNGAGLDLRDPGTKAALDAIAAFLVAHPEIAHVRVEGHTDNTGDGAAKHALSGKRADALIAWLGKHGVPASRLRSMGVGGDSPLQDNTTEEGRKANERIELHVEQ